MSSPRKSRTTQYPNGSEPRRYPPRTAAAWVTSLGDRDAVRADPAVHDVPVEIGEERVDVRGAVGLVVEEVGVLVDVQRHDRRRVPDRERVLRVAEVVEKAAFVPVVGCPGPAAAGHPR